VWLTDLMGKRYSQRPSRILGIRDELAAWNYDVAAMTLGMHVEAETADGKRKAVEVLGALSRTPLSQTPLSVSTPTSPHLPAKGGGKMGGGSAMPLKGMVGRRVRVREDGTW